MTEIRRMEELSLNAWPALQTLLLDGWILRWANGYTKRANSVNPLYPSSDDIATKLTACEQFYASHKLPVVFKLTREVYPSELDALLEERGYKSDSTTSVQLLDLGALRDGASASQMNRALSEEWLTTFCRLSSVNFRNRSTLRQMLSNASASTAFFSLKEGTQTVACGIGVVQEPFIGLFDIVTHAGYRNRGYGRQLVCDILRWGKEQGARTAYLQVMLNNAPALRLYSNIGFTESYQYWYRIST